MNLWYALAIIGVIVGFFWLDEVYFQMDALAFLGKQVVRMTDWLAFWR